ncbi:MAG: GNAT family N-acetyltransferase [Ginsengibacter sp.]
MEQEIDIIDYSDDLAMYFAELNLAWIEKYFIAEEADHKYFSDPKSQVINKGGHIFFATINKEVVGTFALLKIEEGVYELSKMAVDECRRGKNIGNKLLEHCIVVGRQLNATKLILYSNTILQPAIHLYKKYGFKEVALDKSEYKRSNVKMELTIN